MELGGGGVLKHVYSMAQASLATLNVTPQMLIGHTTIDGPSKEVGKHKGRNPPHVIREPQV